MVWVLVLTCLVCGAYADSDHTGLLRGSTETFTITLTNSTGVYEPQANCSARILQDMVLIVNYTEMSNLGEGLYSYTWDVPESEGLYYFLVNCTTLNNENYTAGGTVFVKNRLFEKEVGRSVFKYDELHTEETSGVMAGGLLAVFGQYAIPIVCVFLVMFVGGWWAYTNRL